MHISIVIPTCNRKPQLINLLQSLNHSLYPILEVIIIDSGEDRLTDKEMAAYSALAIAYHTSEKSVCIQRNKGIQLARGEWIFLCDDDIEISPDYLQKLMGHANSHPDAGAIAGALLERTDGEWKSSYPERSSWALVWKFIFGLSIWGEIECGDNNFLTRRIVRYYKRKGNHISKAGWPVITQFSGEYFTTPLYGLGASVVKKDWLTRSPYDEVLDRHGMGDNYGVAMGFPGAGIHVLNTTWVYHHREPANRLQRPLQYLRRVLALHYFSRSKPRLKHVKKGWLLWSLAGNLVSFFVRRDWSMIRPGFRAFWLVAGGRNPYQQGAIRHMQRVEPSL